MKRTTTTTEHFDADGKLTERIVVTTEEDEYVPPPVYPYTPNVPYPNTYPWITYTSGQVTATDTSGFMAYNGLHLVPPPDDDGLAGVPAIA